MSPFGSPSKPVCQKPIETHIRARSEPVSPNSAAAVLCGAYNPYAPHMKQYKIVSPRGTRIVLPPAGKPISSGITTENVTQNLIDRARYPLTPPNNGLTPTHSQPTLSPGTTPNRSPVSTNATVLQYKKSNNILIFFSFVSFQIFIL